ncbi:tandem-95 repeat protein [Candidatus Poribacteria bacterium]|nr:tandem-95 repeat protein [Candidatus Poribacteria bacterium]
MSTLSGNKRVRKLGSSLVLAVFLTACFVLVASNALAQQLFEYKPVNPPTASFVSDELLVKFKLGVGAEKIKQINRRNGVKAAKKNRRGVFRLKVKQGMVQEKWRAYKGETNVEYAEPNYIATAHLTPNDPIYPAQWNLNNSVYGGIQMERGWDIQTGIPGVIVAVIDTGVAYENYGMYYQAPDLANTTFVPGYDFVENDTHPNDDNSHGTHVAGTLAQSTTNGVGTVGVAFNTAIMPVKVLNNNGTGTYADIANGIIWATDNGAQVINLSLGGSSASTTLADAVAYAYNAGVTVIAAAGNDGVSQVRYPAAYDDYVIAVGATIYDETRASYSNYGSSLDLVAPGGDVSLDQNGDGYGDGVLQNTFNPNTRETNNFGYWFFQGTSMAAPHVSGVAALLIAEGVATTPDQVRAALQSTAEDKGAAGWDPEYGWGIVDAHAALNHAPVADNQSVTTAEEAGVAITLTATDVDGDPLTYSLVSGPSSGSLSGTVPNLTYTPNLNFNGSDSFTFTANDGIADSNLATVSLTVTPVTDPPVASDQSVTTRQDTPVAVTLTASDVDGDALSYSVVTLPANGSLSGIAPNLTYTPNLGFTGPDSFTFKANDGIADSNLATVSLTVTINNPPVADNQSVTTAEEAGVAITLTATDVDGDPLSFSLVTPPANGSLSGTAPNLTYTPNLHFNGSDSLTFKANDGIADSNLATVSITVTPVNDPPVSSDQSVTTAENTGVAITLTATDVDGDPLTYSLVSGPSSGSLSGTAPNLTYTPNLHFNGSDSLTFKANDGIADSNLATVSITVISVNDAPVAVDDADSVDEDNILTVAAPGVLTNDTDVDGDALTAVWVSGPANGTLTLNADGSFTYTPNANFNGTDSFTYKANDGALESNVATLAITVHPPPFLETGVVPGVGNSGWTPVTLSRTYTSMVVVCSANYDQTVAPGVVRVRNAASNSFEIRVDNTDGATPISGVTVHYMVVEEGIYTAGEHGVKMEAVKFTSTMTDGKGPGWVGETRSYSNTYTTPVVVGQVMTDNDNNFSVFWCRNGSSHQDAPDSSGLRVGKHVGQDLNTTRANETIGYIVIESGNGTMGTTGYVAALGADTIKGVGDSPPYSYTLSGMSSVSTAIAGQAAMDAQNGGWAVLYGANSVTPTILNLAIDEDQAVDSSITGSNNRKHPAEQVAYIVFGTIEIPAAPSAQANPKPHVPAVSMLPPNYPNPANPETWIPFRLSQAGDVTLRIYDVTGRLVRTLDLGHKAPGIYVSKSRAAYWDGSNANGERVSSGIYLYLMEAGSFRAMRKMVIMK